MSGVLSQNALANKIKSPPSVMSGMLFLMILLAMALGRCSEEKKLKVLQLACSQAALVVHPVDLDVSVLIDLTQEDLLKILIDRIYENLADMSLENARNYNKIEFRIPVEFEGGKGIEIYSLNRDGSSGEVILTGHEGRINPSDLPTPVSVNWGITIEYFSIDGATITIDWSNFYTNNGKPTATGIFITVLRAEPNGHTTRLYMRGNIPTGLGQRILPPELHGSSCEMFENDAEGSLISQTMIENLADIPSHLLEPLVAAMALLE